MRKTVLELCALSGISGREGAVRAYLENQLKDAPAVREMRTDRLGNLIVELCGKQRAPQKVLFAAHMDEVGGIVTGITDDGYLRFDTVGGIMPEVLFARRVSVNGHIGVIGGKAIHQCKGDDKTKVPAIETLRIDIGAASYEEAAAVVRIGDAVLFTDGAAELGGERFLAKALDDRAGCALLLMLAKTQPQYDVTIVFTVQEEVGSRGAGCAAFALAPDIAVAVDSTTASDVVGTPSEKQVCRVGGGAVVSFMDRRTVYDKALYDEIFRLAEVGGIRVQPKTLVAGGNDAGSMQVAREGARVAAISLPCRYIHSPSCVLDEGDLRQTYRLLEVMMNTLPAWDGAL